MTDASAAALPAGIPEALARGDLRAQRLLPPLIRCSGRRSVVIGQPRAAAGAELVREALEAARFHPWREGLARIARFCGRHRRWRSLAGPENGLLHGHVLRPIYCAAALAPPDRARRVAGILVRNHLGFLRLLIRRLERDFGGPRGILDLKAQTGDPHRGGQCVVEVSLRDGRRYAYKPRSVEPEGILFGRGWRSIAELVNESLRRGGESARLPLLEVRAGSGRHGRHYGYIGWIDAEPFLKRLRRGRAAPLVMLPDRLIRPAWRDAGLLAAFAYASGITDLHQSNLVVGAGPDGAVRYHPVDAEFAASRPRDLEGTCLVRSTIAQLKRGHAHAGFETVCHPCGAEDDYWGFARLRGRWTLRKIVSGAPACHPSTVADERGRVGYRHYLAEFLGGLLAGYDNLLRGRGPLRAALRRGLSRARVRYIPRPTGIYGDQLRRRMFGERAQQAFSRPRRTELRQLDNLDVPYFFRRGGGPILYYERYPSVARRAGSLPRLADSPRRGYVQGRLAAGDFTVLLQDALDHVVDARRPLRVRQDGVLVERRRGSSKTFFEGRAAGRSWRVLIDSRKGLAEVEVAPTRLRPEAEL